MSESTLFLIILCRVRFIFLTDVCHICPLKVKVHFFCCPQSGLNCDLIQLSVGVLTGALLMLISAVFLILCPNIENYRIQLIDSYQLILQAERELVTG